MNRTTTPIARDKWLLDHATASSVLMCDDPAESLARSAANTGRFALELIAKARFERWPVLLDFTIETNARRAWRFAEAAIDLHNLHHVVRAAPSEQIVVIGCRTAA